MVELTALKCKPCEGGIPPMDRRQAETLWKKITDWELHRNMIKKVYVFRDFKESMKFVNRIARLAEDEGHHPDIEISWNKVTLKLTTHAIGGLSQNDFILAAKIDRMTS